MDARLGESYEGSGEGRYRGSVRMTKHVHTLTCRLWRWETQRSDKELPGRAGHDMLETSAQERKCQWPTCSHHRDRVATGDCRSLVCLGSTLKSPSRSQAVQWATGSGWADP